MCNEKPPDTGNIKRFTNASNNRIAFGKIYSK